MKSSYMLDGIEIKRPDSFKIERYIVSDLSRIANGDMVGDLISRKRKFYFVYDAISSDSLTAILNIIWESEHMYHTLTYTENNVTKTAIVYPGSIPSTLGRTGGLWVWKNVNFSLIEK